VAYTYSQAHVRQKPTDDFAPFEVRRYGRHWEVRDPAGDVVCLTVYRRGAAEVVRRLKLNLASSLVSDLVHAGLPNEPVAR